MCMKMELPRVSVEGFTAMHSYCILTRWAMGVHMVELYQTMPKS